MNETDDNRLARDRVRALVREVLENAVVIDDEAAPPTDIASNNAFAEIKPPNSAPTESVQTDLSETNFAQTGAAQTDFDLDESAQTLITEADLRGLAAGARLRVAENARFTPLALDFVGERQIEIVRKPARESSFKIKTVAVGADHGGFEFKEKLKKFLAEKNLNVRDFGTDSEAAVDYPDFAHAVARAVADKTVDIGIVIDGAGIGSAIAANKIQGVRAAACYNVALAKNSREHNGANVLTLGSKQNSFAEICEIVQAFLSSELTEERHRKRVEKIEAIARRL